MEANTTIEAYFTSFTKEDIWVHGKCGPYNFTAKLYDTGSEWGINDGRVSKLSIADAKTLFVNYDRGWDIKPKKAINPYYEAIMQLLEAAPKRFQEVGSN